jgi:putative Holliday junction resolvase
MAHVFNSQSPAYRLHGKMSALYNVSHASPGQQGMSMRVLGLDVGDRRIGIAISDDLRLTAQGLSLLERQSRGTDLAILQEIIAAYHVDRIVVGMPRNMDGSYGLQAQKTEQFIQVLEQTCQLPCIRWDERLTTLQAERLLIAAKQNRQKRKAVRDKIAAQLILQNYLDNQRRFSLPCTIV